MSRLSNYLKSQFNPKRPTSAILALKKNKDSMLDELESATSFLNAAYSEVTINQRLYHYINQVNQVLECEYCGKPRAVKEKNARIVSSHANPKLQGHYITTCSNIECKKKHNLVKTEDGVMKKHGVKNISQTSQWHEKIKKTNQEKYGVNYQTQSTNFKEKTKQTNLKKYGKSAYTQTKEYLDKSAKTCLKKYGTKYPTQSKNVMDKVQQTNRAKYGVNWSLQNIEIREKAKISFTKKYGANHPMQNEEFFEKLKDRFMKFKEFEFPSGKIARVQGYEIFALKDLISKGVAEKDIIIENIKITEFTKKIMYTDLTGAVRRYYPDIYILPTNTIIEVKSSYTYACSKEINMRKRQATLDLGVNFEFWIYHPNGTLIERII